MAFPEWPQLPLHILEFEQRNLVTRTFRRLDPQRQQAILLAILEEAAEYGPADINIKRVAERSGVAVGSLYQYFNHRESMLQFAIELCRSYLTDMFETSLPYLEAMPLQEALRSYLMVGIEWSQMQAGLVRFFGRAAYHGDPALREKLVEPVAKIMYQATYVMLEAASDRGELRPGVDLDAAAHAVNTWLITIADSQLFPHLNVYFQASDEQTPFLRSMETMLDILAHGLQP